ncbi:hypothetical protein Tco_0459087 [Tanacetum coccineum]
MNRLEMGKHKAVWSGMTDEMCKDVMDSVYTTWKRRTDENPSVTSNGAPFVVNSLDSVKSNLLDVRIIQSVIVQDKPNSYAGGSKLELTKSNAKFRSLSLENMCKGAKFSIPRKVVEMENLTMGVPLIKGTGFTIKTITIEYEWKPPQCDLCKIFGHVQDHCPKKVSITPIVVTSNVATPTFGGHSVKQTVRYEPKTTKSAPKKRATNMGNASKPSFMLKITVTSATQGNIPILNPYSALDDEGDEEVKNVYDESANLFQSKKDRCDSLLCHSQFTLSEALAKKKAPFGVMFSTSVGTKDVSSVSLVGTEESCVDEVYFAFGWHLEDLHVTWAHLEKKRTRLRTNTKILEDLSLQTLETASEAIHDAVAAHQATASQDFMTASARADSKADLEDSFHDGVTPIKRRRKRDCVERIPASIFSLCYLFRNSFLSTTMGDENPIRTLGDYSRPSHEGYRNTIELPVGNNVDLALYDNKSWNDPRDFAKPVKAIALPQDVPSTSDRRLIELETQVQRLMEAHLAPTQPTQVNKITTSCEIYSGPHDTQNCMENPKQAFVDYASTRTYEAGEGLVSEFMASQDARLSRIEADFKRQQSEMTNKIDTVLRAITNQIAGILPSDTVKNPR